MISTFRMISLTNAPRCLLVALALLALHAQVTAWRSTLYPDSWQRPDETASFYTDKLIQDFSYAGYKSGEEDIPAVAGPIFDATTYGADPTGAADSTAAIQSAIDAAEAAGGGVVLIPAGLYLISPQGTNSHCLRISASNIVLRGAGAASTRLLNTSTDMRSKRVISIQPASTDTGPAVNFTADLNGPTRRLPVATPEEFAPGDIVRLQWSFTADWIAEHGQQLWWSATSGPADAQYLRQVTAVNAAEGWIEVNVPTRYTMKTRDQARVMKRTGMISGVGIESLAIGNVQLTGTTWGENDYTDATKPAYDAHASYLLVMMNAYDSWITGVESFQPAGNTSTCHMLSNGILVQSCMRVTVGDCKMSRPQYGGGGGNGYMYRLSYSNECLVRSCVADFSRHGIVVSVAGTSGNVFLQCEDRETQRATGHSGSYTTVGSGSDNHMHFSHSNLWDSCHAYDSFYTAHHRGESGTIPHALTSAHGVYWNTSGGGTRYNNIVVSEQARYGYVIGTSGSKSGASNTKGGNTAPADHLEGIGAGATLEPASLYLDQLSRRTTPRLALSNPTVQFPHNTFVVDVAVTLDGAPLDAGLLELQWNVTNMPSGASVVSTDSAHGQAFTVTQPGSYTMEASIRYNGKSYQGARTIEVLPPAFAGQTLDLPAVADSHVQSGTSATLNFGGASTLALKNDGGTNVEREAFMRFDLTEVDMASVESAALHAYFTSTGIDANGRTSVVDDAAGWGEMTINWNNRPTVQNALIGDWVPSATAWKIFDITSVIPSQLEANGTITFRHQIVNQSGTALYYIASKENSNASLRPFLRLTMAAQTLAAWLSQTSDLVAPDLDPDDDPDGDGMVNLIEAWLGTHAGQAQSNELPQLAMRNGQLEFDLQVNANPPAGLFYFLESSDSLGNDWQPVADTSWDPRGPVANGRQPITVSVPYDPAAAKRFYRFVVRTP